MDDGDECFDLDDLEYASGFRAPTDHSSGEVVVMIQGDSLDRAGLGAVPFVIGGYGYLIPELIGLLRPPT